MVGNEVLYMVQVFFWFPGQIFITFPLDLEFGLPCSFLGTNFFMSDNVFYFPFFLSVNEVCWWLSVVWSMNIVFFIWG